MRQRAEEHHGPHHAARDKEAGDKKPERELLWYLGWHQKGVSTGYWRVLTARGYHLAARVGYESKGFSESSLGASAARRGQCAHVTAAKTRDAKANGRGGKHVVTSGQLPVSRRTQSIARRTCGPSWMICGPKALAACTLSPPELNERGILTARGGAWHPTSAARLLSRVQA
jgi:hypothetical protein